MVKRKENKKKVGLRMDIKVIDMLEYIAIISNEKKISIIEAAIENKYNELKEEIGRKETKDFKNIGGF